jgi:hypothetical protein
MRSAPIYLIEKNVDVFRALIRALERVGGPAPKNLNLPADVSNVITWSQLGIEYRRMEPIEQGESISIYRNRMKARLRRAFDMLVMHDIVRVAEMPDYMSSIYDKPIGHDAEIEKPRMIYFIWPTGRPVYGRGLLWPNTPTTRLRLSELKSVGDAYPVRN